MDSFLPFAKDTGISTAGLSLYLSTPKADYLRGGAVSVNCKFNTLCLCLSQLMTKSGDVEEMEEHKSEIVDKKLLKIAFLNANLGPDGHPWET